MPRNTLSDIQKLEIIEKYKTQKITGRELAKQYKISESYASTIVSQYSPHKKHKILNNEERQEILNLCKNDKFSVENIAKEYGISISTIYELLRKNNIQLPTKNIQTYTIDEHYFDKIDNEHKAYWLGFLYADGYNHESRHMVVLSLWDKDKDILCQFNRDIKSNRPLLSINMKKYNLNSSNGIRLVITNKHISHQLKILGCHQNKSFTLIFPTKEQVPDYLIKHFIRGLWDGDGHIADIDKSKKFTAEFTGTLNLCEHISDILHSMNINCSIRARKGKTHNIRALKILSPYKSVEFLDYLYSNSTVYLDRKYQNYIKAKKKYSIET
jgi:transposase